MGVNSLPKTVTRQRRACDFWTQALLRMSPSWVRFLVYNTGLVQYRWTGLDLVTADRLKMQEWKIVNSSKYSLSCCTYVFHRCRFVLAFSLLAFSTLAYSYLRIPYLHIPSSGTFVFRTCVFSRPTLIAPMPLGLSTTMHCVLAWSQRAKFCRWVYEYHYLSDCCQPQIQCTRRYVISGALTTSEMRVIQHSTITTLSTARDVWVSLCRFLSYFRNFSNKAMKLLLPKYTGSDWRNRQTGLLYVDVTWGGTIEKSFFYLNV